MKRATKIWLLVAAGLVVLGMLAFVCVMAATGWDFNALGSGNYQTDTVEISGRFENISVSPDTSNLTFQPSSDGKCTVIFYDDEMLRTHSAVVKDGTLTVGTVDTRKWYDRIGFTFGKPQITVCLPQTQYAALRIEGSTGKVEIPKDFTFESVDINVSTGDMECCASCAGKLRIKTGTGDIRLESLSAGTLELAVSTGEVDVRGVECAGDVGLTVTTGRAQLTDLTCARLVSAGSTGKLRLENVTVSGLISVERSTGDVTLANCDAAELAIQTTTGDVTGTLRSAKVFLTKTDTGRVEVPESVSGGKCTITTDTGDIKLSIIG